MSQDRPTGIFVIWDSARSDLRIQLQALDRRPPPGTRVMLPDPERTLGDYLRELLQPGLNAADRVLLVAPQKYEMWPSLAFELGWAVGLGKKVGLGQGCSVAVADFAGIEREEDQEISLGELDNARRSLESEASWFEIDLPRHEALSEDVVLTPNFHGTAVREELQDHPQFSRWSFLLSKPGQLNLRAAAARRLLWVVTPNVGRDHKGLENTRCAFNAGLFCGRSGRRDPSSIPDLRVLRSTDAFPIRAARRFESTFSDLGDLANLLDSAFSKPQTLMVERLEVRDFKNIESLTIDLSQPSSLTGDWTCIAGINGAGKSSILQAICMLLLGDKLVTELGGERLKRMLRREGTERFEAELTLVLRDGEQRRTLFLPINENGVDGYKLHYSHPDYSSMRECWERLQKQVLVSYGASRNLSEYKDSRYSHLSRHVQRQMTLFDPLAQIASVDVLLEGGNGTTTAVLKTLRHLLDRVLQGELAPSTENGGRMQFDERGTAIEALDLPDGFRSTVAWLADLCAAWHQTAPPEETESCDPAKIRGIVLLDEIDLHLHPRLQRGLVPRLREALPLVQFIVTTHSPLVLSSFDRAELVVLDRDTEEGVRELDRQIFAFSTDQVYQWLMDTPPQSTVIEEKLERGDDAEAALLLYQSEDRNEAEAKVEIAERKQLIAQLRRSSAQG